MIKLCRLLFVLAGWLVVACSPAYAVRTWVAGGDGLWRVATNWSGGILPNPNSSVLINNTNTETITIDAPTDATNLTVMKLTLSAPPGYTNTLYLNNVTNGPLTCTLGFEMQAGAVVQLTNSALALALMNDHVNIDGRLELDSGSIDFGGTTVTGRVGRVTSGTFVINSGTVNAGVITVGGLTNSSGFINMSGGVFNISSQFSVGRELGTTGTVVVAGGQLFASNMDTRIGESGIGYMTISNATVVLTNADIGHDTLAVGTLNVQNSGLITFFGDVGIARFSGSTGTVFVTGGQINASAQKISLSKGGNGQMNISNGIVQAASLWVAADPTNTANGLLTMSGGNLNLTSDLIVGSVSNSSGKVVISGGTISVTNSGGNGAITLANGNLTFNSGWISTDNLWLTNSAGQFVFNGGTLYTKNTAVTNGAAFVVGNGITPATLYLNGGVHAFGNGLVISSNATLAGCGTIIGTLTMNGTNAMNCGGSVVVPKISSLAKTGVTNVVFLGSVSNQTYMLEYKTNLNDATWTPILPALSGNGGVLMLIDTNATNATRFYHVRTQ